MMLLAVLCAAVAAALSVPSGRTTAVGRLRDLLPVRQAGDAPAPAKVGRGGSGPSRSRPGRLDRRCYFLSAFAGLTGAVLVGGMPGVVAGVIVAVGCGWFLSRLEPREVRKRRARIATDLPVALDLLAACLRGGATWADSADAVARALGGPVGDALHLVSAQVRLGADPVAAWQVLDPAAAGEPRAPSTSGGGRHLAGGADPALAALGRVVSRSVSSGAPLAPTLARLAQDQRRVARTASSVRARAVGVHAVLPLGLCFLPAFVLLSVVPAVAGIAAGVLLP